MFLKRKRVFRFLKKNAYVLVAYALKCMVTFSFILPFTCQDLVYSFFYIHTKDTGEIRTLAIKTNENRAVLADKYFTGKHDRMKSSFDNEPVDIAIGVVSVKRIDPRHKLGYLTQTMAQLDKLTRTDRHFRRKSLFICNAEPVASQHVEADQLSHFFPVKHHGGGWGQAGSVYEKEKLDYVFCLQEAMKYNPRYVLILEDDFLPRDSFFTVLSTVLHNHLAASLQRVAVAQDNWAFLKLYYPERWQGYANEISRILELVGIGCLGGVFLVLCYILCRQESSAWECYCMFGLGAAYLILVAVLVGRQYVIELKHASPDLYSLRAAPECCTPAVLYPARQVAPLINYLRGVRCSNGNPFDFVLDNFAKKRKLRRYLVEPNLGRHIGMFSSLKGVNKPDPGQFLF